MHLFRIAAVTMFCLSLGPAVGAETKLPPDVARYVAQREGCDHFRSEIPDTPDEQRIKEIERQIHELCTGTDKRLQHLKRKYAKSPMVLKRLNEFEEKIE